MSRALILQGCVKPCGGLTCCLSQAISFLPFNISALMIFNFERPEKEQTAVRRISESMLTRALVITAFLLALMCVQPLAQSSVRGVRMYFFAAQEQGKALSLPRAKGAWLIEMSRDGGMRPVRHTVQINSDGEIYVTTERYVRGNRTIDCSLKAKVSAAELLQLKESVRLARLSAWRTSYSDPKHPICCDQPTTRFELHQRGTNGAKMSYPTAWYPGSSQMRPSDLVQISTLGQTLWTKMRERCDAQPQ
jgi:hypothetical protein